MPVRSFTYAASTGWRRVRRTVGLFDVFVRAVREGRSAGAVAVRVNEGVAEEGEPVRAARCDDCNRELDLEVAHFRHDLDCDRYMRGVCSCEGSWVCAACCPDTACVTPLAATLRAAHQEQQEGVA